MPAVTPPPKPPAGTAHRASGVLVLGMHRSGTSLVAGILAHLGLDGGPRASMLAPDEFNSDGYWEQRPIVEWHDRILATLGGWASAPPPTTVADLARAADEVGPPAPGLAGLFTSPWFVKDPRQCLLLPAWTHHAGIDDTVVVVVRRPGAVISSLTRRNGYSPALAGALWERYNHDLFRWMRGRSCLVVDYDRLCQDPATVVGGLARSIEPALGRPPDERRLTSALALVEPRVAGPSATVRTTTALWELIEASVGSHESLDVGEIGPLSEAAVTTLERRRRRLNRIRPIVGRSSAGRAALDQLPARVRATFRRGPRALATEPRRAR